MPHLPQFRYSLEWMKSQILQHSWEKKKGAPWSKEEGVAPCLSLGHDEGQVKRSLEDVMHTCFTTQGFAQVPEKIIQISNLPKSWPTNVLTLLDLHTMKSVNMDCCTPRSLLFALYCGAAAGAGR